MAHIIHPAFDDKESRALFISDSSDHVKSSKRNFVSSDPLLRGDFLVKRGNAFPAYYTFYTSIIVLIYCPE